MFDIDLITSMTKSFDYIQQPLTQCSVTINGISSIWEVFDILLAIDTMLPKFFIRGLKTDWTSQHRNTTDDDRGVISRDAMILFLFG
jgi:hypothetical protein